MRVYTFVCTRYISASVQVRSIIRKGIDVIAIYVKTIINRLGRTERTRYRKETWTVSVVFLGRRPSHDSVLQAVVRIDGLEVRVRGQRKKKRGKEQEKQRKRTLTLS